MASIKKPYGTRGKVIWLQCTIPDLSTANQGAAVYVPENGVITEVYSVLGDAIGTADAVITLTNAGTAWAGGTVTIAYTSSDTGDIDSQTGLSEDVTAGTYISAISAGASTNTVPAHLTFKLIVPDGVTN